MTNGGAKLAIDLVTFDAKYEKAMQFCFGSAFVCDNAE